MAKKILIINDSALMRSIISDIINSDKKFEVKDAVENGADAIKLLETNSYDCIVLDSMMPKMRGAKFLETISEMNVDSVVVVLSDIHDEGNVETFKCLEAGAVDFIKIPTLFMEMKSTGFRENFVNIMNNAIEAGKKICRGEKDMPRGKRYAAGENAPDAYGKDVPLNLNADSRTKPVNRDVKAGFNTEKSKLVAIACSTGGPKALQCVLPYIPANIDAPILIVQHMPKVFTSSLAERLDSLSELKVREAGEGDVLEKGVVYIAKGGYHMSIAGHGKTRHVIRILDDPPIAGLKPCADVMYESLADTGYERITCVVMTGMGSDGTRGIRQLKTKKNVYVIAQNEVTSTVYGMPKAIHEAGLTDEVVPLNKISEAIIRTTGVR